MKTAYRFLPLLAAAALLSACEKDEGKLPKINFKTGDNYVSSSATKMHGDSVLIGITASKAEKKDPLKKFNISKSVDGGNSTTVFNKDLSGSEGDNFSYDYKAPVGETAGMATKYTFTVTNRDGLVNHVDLTLTAE